MSVFVDFVGLNTLVSSSFETGSFNNIISSGLNEEKFQMGTKATGEIDLDASPGASVPFSISDGGLGGGVGSVTFTYVNAGSDNDEIVRDGTLATAVTNTVTKINAFPNLNLTASGNTTTGKITITNLFAGGAGNVPINLGFGSLVGTATGMSGGEQSKLAAINIHRNGPYNFATFKQIRIHENPLTRFQRRNNLISFSKRPEQREITDANNNLLFVQEKFGDLVTFTEPSLVSTYHPLVYNVGTLQGETVRSYNRFGLSFDYSNHITYFTNKELNELLLLDDLDDEVYEQIKELYLNGALESNASEIDYFEFLRYKQDIYPREINKYRSHVRQRTNYENTFWRDVREDRQITTTAFDTAYFVSMWNMDANENWSTRSSVALGLITSNTRAPGILQNGFCHFENQGAGIIAPAPIYNRKHSITGSYNSSAGRNLDYSASVVAPSGIPIPETGSGGVGTIFQGDALWEAGEQAGKNPFYSTYDFFIEELRGAGKGFSIVPEFKISDHVETLLTNGNLTILPTMLEITGGEANSNKSNESNFYETYSTSDFLKHFAKIKKDHKDFEDPSRITLTCKGLKKFLVYDSFYPQDRSVDCVEQFYSSYSDYITFDNTGDARGKQPILDPLFAPGVLYNTIKSGIAVDYPVRTESITIYNAGGDPTDFFGIGDGNFDKRIPFESLVEPEKYMAESLFVSNVVHPSGSTNATASWDGQCKDNLYTKMMSNYLAETVDFFMKDSELSTVASIEQGNTNFGIAEFGKTYGMRLKIYKTMDRAQGFFPATQITEGEVDHEKFGGFVTPQANKGHETITMYSRPSAFGPPCAGYDTSSDTIFLDSRNGWNPSFTPPYYDGSAWIDFLWEAPAAGTAALSAGQQTGKFSLSEILSSVKAYTIRFDAVTWEYNFLELNTTGVLDKGILKTAGTSITGDFPNREFFDTDYYNDIRRGINVNSMQTNASVNVFQAGKLAASNFENKTSINVNQQFVDVNKGSPDARWVIQTKFETPILNFKDVSLTTASVNLHSAQTPRGMWHQHGVIPNNDEGVYMQIENLPESWLFRKNPGESPTTVTLTGSLADVCGFSTEPVKLGQISQGKKISEAVVAIPYIEESGVKKFFEIENNNFQNAKRYFQALDIVNKGGDPTALGLGDPEFFEKRSGASVIDQVRKMRKYVFPPTMDFFNYPEITPFSMYIFEFNHTLSQQDLANIWQGIPPEIGTSFEIAEDSISHPLLANQLLGSGKGTDRTRIGDDLNDEIRWMVFKVKKKAKTNYFSKVVGKKAGFGDAALAAGFETNASTETAQQSRISYNWPYDFFSLVELVKIDAEIEFSQISQEDESGPKFTPKRREIPEAVKEFQASLSRRRR
jgi:hypothetical protein